MEEVSDKKRCCHLGADLFRNFKGLQTEIKAHAGKISGDGTFPGTIRLFPDSLSETAPVMTKNNRQHRVTLILAAAASGTR